MLTRSLLFLTNFLLVISLAPHWSNDTISPFLSLFSSETCDYVKIKSGQTAYVACGSKTSIKNLQKYNADTNLNNLKIGQVICCSSGNMPNLKPSSNSDGSCKTYIVKSGDTCSAIASSYYPLSVKEIEKYNSENFGWKGCNKLQKEYKLCISDGKTPRPTPNPKAECGPLAPGDKYNTKCPLNACCSEFGFCGLTSEFCDKKSSTTGAPGTSGCYSNCGYGHLHTDTRGDFDKITYWLDSEGSLASNPSDIGDEYSIVHYAFVNINSDFSIDDSKISKSYFLYIKQKKVASFGGWDFSTNPSTYKIFRDIVSNVNSREKFATNVVNFLKKYNLDGIDLDWEYPGAPDIPGIPADYSKNGDKYNELLKLIKSKLPSGKTLSIAIPASYWYLKNYPIKDIQANIDYQVFMTYDIHGTWDLDKDPHVKCHTNKTEVIDALKMLDKAGVQIGKTYGGLANYGRSYKLTSDSCTGVGCQFSGGGDKGPITDTAGVLGLSEIDDINSWSTKNKRWTDDESQCDFMTYGSNNVVAWPKEGQRNSMEEMFHSSGLKGSVLWVDNYFKHDNFDSDVNYVPNDLTPENYWNDIWDEDNDYLGEISNIKIEFSSSSTCNKDPSSINLDSESNAECLYLGMSYELLNKGQKALNYIKNIDRKSYSSDHKKYVQVISDSLWLEFDDWLGYNLFKTDKNDKDGEGDKYYNCMHNGKPMPEGHEGQCITDGACFNLACSVFGSSNRRISNFIIKDGMKDEAAKSFSDYSGLSIKGSDFVTNKNKKEVKQSGGQTITYNNCDFVDFSKEFPNPLDKIDNEYLDNMQSILDKVKSDYKKSPIEAYYSLTPLAALDDVSETMKTVKEQAKKFRDQERKQRILSIIGFVFMGISILAMPFGIAVNLAVDTALLIATTVAELKLTGKVSGDSLAFGLIAIIQPFVKFPGDSLSTIFKNIDLDQVTKLNGKFKANNKFEDIIKNKIKNKYC